MKGWSWSGGRFRPCDSVPLSDRGFRYGMSVFESFPVRNGAPLFLPEHLARLDAACAQCGFTIETAALTTCGDTLRDCDNGFARLYVTAGDGAVSAPLENPRVYLFVEAREPTLPQVYHRGYDLGIASEPHRPLFAGLKTANYWANADAFRRGLARQKNETLLWNPDGWLISACMANVFAVFGEKITTPSRACGAREGVVREWIFRQCEVLERDMTPEDLRNAGEVFLTSSWLGVMPAASLEGKPFPSRKIATALREEYERMVAR